MIYSSPLSTPPPSHKHTKLTSTTEDTKPTPPSYTPIPTLFSTELKDLKQEIKQLRQVHIVALTEAAQLKGEVTQLRLRIEEKDKDIAWLRSQLGGR